MHFIPPNTDPLLFLVLGSLSAALFSLGKSGFGGSLGLLGVPLMIYACGGDSDVAIGIMLPLLIACDYFAVASWRGQWQWQPVRLLLPGAAIGILLGAIGLWGIQEIGTDAKVGSETADQILALCIGAIALVFVMLQALRSLKSDPIRFRPVLWQGTLVGAAAGFTSTFAHASGPIVAMYMLPQGMPKSKYVATTVLYYWIGNQLKVPPYLLLGLIDSATVLPTLVLLPAVLAGVLLGVYLHRRVGQKQFAGVVYTLLALTGAHLAITAARELWM